MCFSQIFSHLMHNRYFTSKSYFNLDVNSRNEGHSLSFFIKKNLIVILGRGRVSSEIPNHLKYYQSGNFTYVFYLKLQFAWGFEGYIIGAMPQYGVKCWSRFKNENHIPDNTRNCFIL